MPRGLDTENASTATVPTPNTMHNDVAIRMFFLATSRSSGRPPVSLSAFPSADLWLVLSAAAELLCSNDSLMVRSRDLLHLQTVRSVTIHVNIKATQATLVAICGRLAAERMVPATAPRHTAQRVARFTAGCSSAFDIAMISGVSCKSRGSFLHDTRRERSQSAFREIIPRVGTWHD